MQPKYHVSLRILDDEDFDLPDEITKQTGIQPTAIWHRGEVKVGTSIHHKDNGWELKSSLPLECSLVDHVKFLLAAVKSAHQQVLLFTSKHYSILACAVYFDEESPEIYFDNELLRQIADLNLKVDLDIYCQTET